MMDTIINKYFKLDNVDSCTLALANILFLGDLLIVFVSIV